MVFNLANEFHIALPVFSKLLLGAVLGALIGLERETRGRPAGIRTHMLIVIGVVLICEVSKAFGGDDARIAAQIVTGIGFIGAGTILRTGVEIRGLTTAASVWAASAVGMAISVGGAFIMVAILATILILITLAFVFQVEHRFHHRSEPRELWIQLASREDLVSVIESLNESEINVESLRVHSGDPLEIVVTLSGSKQKAIEAAGRSHGVKEAKWSG